MAQVRQLEQEAAALRGVKRNDLRFPAVSNLQIIAALNKECDRSFAQGILYQVLKEVANEARRKGLLRNPNRWGNEFARHGSEDTGRMKPSAQGWEMTKGILSRQLADAVKDLEKWINDLKN